MMNNIDLNYPQRQSKKGLLVIFFSILKLFLKSILPLLLILFLKNDNSDKSLKYIIILGALLIFISIISLLNFLYFKFYIKSETSEFIIEKGWLNKSKTVIKLNKIQQVNLNQKFIHKLINLYSVEVDTAGTSQTEVKINAVSANVAHALKRKLLEKEILNSESITQQEIEIIDVKEEVNEKKIINISISSLVKVGLTRHYLQTFSLIFLLLIQLIEKIQDYYRDEKINVYSEFGNYAEKNFSLIFIPFIIILVFLLVLITNLVRTLFKYYNYKIQIVNKSLLISYGLFETKNSIIKAKRVQMLSITQNFFQKILNVIIVKIFQTNSETNSSKKGIGIDIPGVNSKEEKLIINEIFKKQVHLENEIKPSIRKFIVHFIWFSIFPSIIYFTLSLKYFEYNYIYLTLVLFLFTALYQWVTYKNSAFYFTDTFIVRKSGFWDVTYSIIEPHKIQKIVTYQRIWHQKLNLSSVILYTAGGNIHFSITDGIEIKKRVNFWLYKVEKENLNWM